jgi:hypothetical protein
LHTGEIIKRIAAALNQSDDAFQSAGTPLQFECGASERSERQNFRLYLTDCSVSKDLPCAGETFLPARANEDRIAGPADELIPLTTGDAKNVR